jgi:hypothetical protein
MMLARQARRYWRYYSPIYQQVKKDKYCLECERKVKFVEVDHIDPIGARPHTTEEFGVWLEKLLHSSQAGLCKKHHLEKTRRERSKKNAKS